MKTFVFIPFYEIYIHIIYLFQKDITTSKKDPFFYLFIFLILFVKIEPGGESLPGLEGSDLSQTQLAWPELFPGKG